MRIKNFFAAAVAAAVSAVVFSAAFSPVQASLVFIFDESTPNTVVVRGSGSVNTTLLGAPNYVIPGPFTLTAGNIWSDYFAVGGETVATVNAWLTDGSGGADFAVIQGVNVLYSGSVASAASPSGPTAGSYMEFSPNPIFPQALGLNAAYVSGSPLSNTTTLTGYTRADFGYSPTSTWASPTLEGTWTLHNLYDGTPTGETITIYSVPEPAHMTLVAGLGAAAFGAWRMRRRSPRRSDEASGC